MSKLLLGYGGVCLEDEGVGDVVEEVGRVENELVVGSEL